MEYGATYVVIYTSLLSKQSNIFSLSFSRVSSSICFISFTYHEEVLHFSQMGWLQSLLCPLKKLWFRSFRMHSAPRKNRGIYILYEDVKSCTDEDVHVLWSILVESHTVPQITSRK